jgi:lambda repressor-like predicted transcriptional regulator
MSASQTPRAPHERLAPEQIETILRLREEGRTLRYTAAATGVAEVTVRAYAPGYRGKVSNAAIREAFERSPVTAADVARHLEWWDQRGSPATSRVKRTLGLQHENGPRLRTYRKLVDVETVMLIAEAIGISPWSVLPEEDEA